MNSKCDEENKVQFLMSHNKTDPKGKMCGKWSCILPFTWTYGKKTDELYMLWLTH